ncbi:hypothetical protein [Microcoleus sp. FACHB-1515]|nr:hypothetical protein [Microcoleus sp. FACHB-1515]
MRTTSSTPAPGLTFTISNSDTSVSTAGDLLTTFVQLNMGTIG